MKQLLSQSSAHMANIMRHFFLKSLGSVLGVLHRLRSGIIITFFNESQGNHSAAELASLTHFIYPP